MSEKIGPITDGVTNENAQVQMELIDCHCDNDKTRRYSIVDADRSSSTTANAIENDDEVEPSDLRADLHNVVLLVILYFMQGIPLGLLGSISMMLEKRGATYATQANFSIAYWPFNLKLLWAPIVDSCYSQRFGRRKSWLVPVQLLIGLFMLTLSYCIDPWLGDNDTKANVQMLTFWFLMLVFLVATQDIATDGWSLTLLKRQNLGYATLCSGIGYTLGQFFSYTVLISLESAEFCNTYLRSEPHEKGVITLSGKHRPFSVAPFHYNNCFSKPITDSLFVAGLTYILITTLIGICKTEESILPATKAPTIIDVYRLALRILRIPSIKLLAAILLTYKFLWAYYDGMSYFKFLDSGISKDKMISFTAIVSLPLSLAISTIIARHVAGASLMRAFIYPMPLRTVFALSGAAIIWAAPKLIPSSGVAPAYIYIVFMCNDIMYSLFTVSMQYGMAVFFLKISDPMVGATYVTLLNTIINWGSTWPYTLALYFVEYLTWRDCGAIAGVANGNGTLFTVVQTHHGRR